ncbi:MAG: helix-turn-helix transcriptional regulator [Clostridia bacterium]|nr:helix-turn-helix transcriptional regulator [Clostridia bacterium]
MNDSFPRIITLLRTERNITQKDAARDLNISQALLSHYERGARECGLDFLIKIADYYGVSCDYLLGRTSDRSGAKLTVNDLPDPEDNDDNILKGSTLPILNKKLIANSLNIIFDLLQKLDNQDLTNQISVYQMIAVYKMFRILYSANPQNSSSFFSVAEHSFQGFSDASMSIIESRIRALAAGREIDGMKPLADSESLGMSFDSINRDYQLYASSLMNLIRSAEHAMDFSKDNK